MPSEFSINIISDIFAISDLEKRKDYVDRELGTNEFDIDGQRGFIRKKTVYELYFQDKTIKEFNLNKKVLGIIGNGYPGVGAFTRSTVNRWYAGTLPNDRNKVIRLAFWAKCTIEETNKLLECAGMHKLYLKSTGGNNTTNAKSSLQDLVYIFLLKNEDYSFAKSQKITDQLDQLLKKIERDEIAGTGKEKTQTLLDELMKLKKCPADKVVSNDFVSYFNKHLSDLLSSYRALYGSVVDGFVKKYGVCKGNINYELQNSISTLTSSRLKCPKMKELKNRHERNNESDEWRESLINTLYAAYFTKADSNNNEATDDAEKLEEENNEEKKKEKAAAMERVFSRNDIIILGLILNKSMNEINESFLAPAQEPPLYGRNFMENVIRKASSNPACEVCAEVIASKFTREYQDYYDITQKEFTTALNSIMRFYNNRNISCGDHLKYEYELKYFKDVINTLKSLKKYEWIKSISIVKEIYPSKTYDILFFRHLTETGRKELEEKIAAINGPVITPKPDPETKGRQNLFVIHVLRKEKEEKEKETDDKKQETEAGEKPEAKYNETTIYLKKLQVVRPAAYHRSKELLSWYPEKAMFDFLVYKTSVYLKKEKYRKYLLPEEHSRFVKGENIQYELPLHL